MAQSIGLPVSRLIRVTVDLTPLPVAVANFNTQLVIGDSNVLDTVERLRSYDTLNAVAADFGTTAPEYKAATLYFGQSPQPDTLFIGRWAAGPTAGMNVGGPLTAAQMLLSNWTGIINGSFRVTIDGAAPVTISTLNFTGAINLNGVATIIDTALTAATVTWDGSQFRIISNTTGPTSAVSYLTSTGTGTDLSPLLKMTATTSQKLVAGMASETLLNAITTLDGLTTYWYFLTLATTTVVTHQNYLDIAGYVEGSANKHMLGIATNEAASLVQPDSSSIGALLKIAGYTRSAAQYSSTNPYAMTSLFGRACTVDFEGTNTTITLMWKREPGVDPEFLGSTGADALDSSNYNYLAQFTTGTSIIVNGKTASGFYIDEVWGTDWFANAIQTALFNELYSANKVPQTDAGVNDLVTVAEAACDQAVTNGLLAPGVWTSSGFGSLDEGDTLTSGYYVYALPVAKQSAADRAARKSPLIQIAAKLAGAIHTVDVLLTVNR
jgi:hypothetical protein